MEILLKSLTTGEVRNLLKIAMGGWTLVDLKSHR